MYYLPDEEIVDFETESLQEEIPVRPGTPNLKSRKLLKELVKDATKPVCLFGAVPPPEKLGEEVAKKSAETLSKVFLDLNPDAIIVYDIQDEKSRNGENRPFPFATTFCPRKFARDLFLRTNFETIVYQALTPERTAENFSDYLQETVSEYQINNLVFVGGGSQVPLTVPEASRRALRFSNQLSLSTSTNSNGSNGLKNSEENCITLGGITIPERHRDKKDEHNRVLEKHQSGVQFFTSQVIYNSDNMITFLRDYNQLCIQQGLQPARIILAFAPFGRLNTLQFLRWLGVEVAEGTASRVLSRGVTELCIQESIQICRENLRRILDAHRFWKLNVPLGIAVESVSKFRDEQKAAEDLFRLLREELTNYYLSASSL